MTQDDKQYGICIACLQHMSPGVGCTVPVYDDFADGVARMRLVMTEDQAGLDGLCSDCNAPVGELHHPGCDTEVCPRCGGQAFACYCIDGEIDDDDDEY